MRDTIFRGRRGDLLVDAQKFVALCASGISDGIDLMMQTFSVCCLTFGGYASVTYCFSFVFHALDL
jgi:hypothetical protein